MNTPEWLRPDVIGGTVLYAVIGVVVLWLAFVIIDWITPYKLWEQIVQEKNIALAIMVGSMFIALGMIIAAAIHGCWDGVRARLSRRASAPASSRCSPRCSWWPPAAWCTSCAPGRSPATCWATRCCSSPP